MKKIIFIMISLFLSLGFLGSYSAFAAGTVVSSNAIGTIQLTSGGSLSSSKENTVELSKNVHAFYNTNDSSSASKFSTATFNSAGTEQYGVASDSAYIYKNSCTNDPCGTSADPSLPLASGDSSDFSSWTH